DENDLSWVPTELPSSVQFIVSSSSESHKEELKKMGWTVIDVSPMSDEEAACFVDQHMFKYGKYLSDEMRDQLCSHQFSRTPLYMKVVLDELAIAGTRRGVANTKNKLLAIDDAVGLLDSVVDRWEEVYSSAELDTVARTFAFLAIASGGLAEQELRQLVLAENNYPGTAWPAFFGSISWTLANDRGVYRIQNPDLVRVVSQKYLSCDETRIDLQEQLLEFCLGKGSDRHLVERCQLMRSLCRWNELADQLTNPRVFQAVKGLAVVEFWREIGEHSEVSVPERLIAFAKKINGIVLSSAYPFRKGDEIRGRDVNRVGCLLSILGHNEAAIEVFDIFISDYQKQ
ncbi:unnamed protein product, partial [Hapterophycus canaliculatus]